MKAYANVSVNVPSITGCFDYHVPETLQEQLAVGCLVEIPFGTQLVQGIVILLHEIPAVEGTRDIIGLIDPLPVLNPQQIDFARLISEKYFCTLSLAIELMVPPGLNQHADILVSMTGKGDTSLLSLFEKKLIDEIVKRKSIRGRQLDAAFPKLDWRKSIKRLQQAGIVEYHSFLPRPTVRPQMVKTIQLSAGRTELEEYLSIPQKKITTASVRRRKALEFLMNEPEPIPVQWVYAETACNMGDLQNLAEEDLVILGETEWIRDPVSKIEVKEERSPTLSADQELAWQEISSEIDLMQQQNKTTPILLHGVTGSGKTELYIRAAEKVIANGMQAIILVPEISLTPQTVRRFINRFPGRVGLYHSRLTPGERYDTWRRVRAGKIDIIVGPRSALFSPFKNIGLIVVDECDDESYCQSDFGIYYDTRVLVEQYSKMLQTTCIFGSATPDVSMSHEAREGRWRVLNLPTRIQVTSQLVKQLFNFPLAPASPTMGDLPEVRIVDMREELKNGNRSILSVDLQQSLRDTLTAGRQSILYLNRRGKATYIFCRSCGFVIKCPRCDLPLTSHGERNELICHQCGYQRGLPKRCPQCDSTAIRQMGTGTETVEAAVRELLPEANILRWDAETSRFKDAHEIILSHFVNHRADILIGTQMISKGMDFPLVTLVGVILAESGLSLPDYRANERTFQLLTQVAGRAGRSDLGGRVIFQTFQPENYVIQFAARHDYEGFYTQELDQRRRLGYPPFYQIVRIEITNLSSDHCAKDRIPTGQKITGWVEASGRPATEVIGPVPCYFGKAEQSLPLADHPAGRRSGRYPERTYWRIGWCS